MRNESRKTLIATLLDHVNAWRKSEGWSRESVVQVVTEAHLRINGPAITGIRFEPQTTDTFERCKVNADRLFRWLDDSSKDNNLLPANFIPSILAAMPIERRVHCLSDLLLGLDVTVSRRQITGNSKLDAVGLLRSMLKEDTEAQQSVAALIDGAIRRGITSRRPHRRSWYQGK